MKLMDIYEQIDNPLSNPEIIKHLISSYSSGSSFYDKLVSTSNKDYINEEYDEKDSNIFYSKMFNKWKNSVVNMTKENFFSLCKQGFLGLDFVAMRNYLKSVNDVSTKEETIKVLFKEREDKQLQNALQRYRWSALGEGTNWEHICSKFLTFKNDNFKETNHRLYINPESVDFYKILNLFVDKCEDYNLPYYFKFNLNGNRKDRVVISSSTQDLACFLQVLQEIGKENPNLISRMKDPPLLTGKINDWIGYGSEPKATYGNSSFNAVRGRVIESAIQTSTIRWLAENKDKNIAGRSEETFLDNFALKATEIFLSRLQKQFERKEFEYKEKGLSFDTSQIEQEVGFSIKDIQSSYIKQEVSFKIKDSLIKNMPFISEENFIQLPLTALSFGNGKTQFFTSNDIIKTVQNFSASIIDFDPNFERIVVSQIEENAQEYGIDTSKFCFDSAVVQNMREQDQKLEEKIDLEKNDNNFSLIIITQPSKISEDNSLVSSKFLSDEIEETFEADKDENSVEQPLENESVFIENFNSSNEQVNTNNGFINIRLQNNLFSFQKDIDNGIQQF